MLDAQDGTGDQEIDDEPGGVHESRNKRVGKYRRIHLNFLSNQGHHPTNTGSHTTYCQQGQPDDQPDIEIKNESGNDQPKRAQQQSQAEPGAHFSGEHAKKHLGAQHRAGPGPASR